MAEYRLSHRARADLIDIYDFTESKFGAYQADAYHAGLVRSCGLLADFPRIGQRVCDQFLLFAALGRRDFDLEADLDGKGVGQQPGDLFDD